MIFKCSQDQCARLLFFSMDEVQDHAQAFGVAHANVEQVDPSTQLWVDVKSGRHTFREQEKDKWMRNDPSAQFELHPISFLLELRKKKSQEHHKQDKFLDSVNQKKLEMLTFRGNSRILSAKALHFTKGEGSLEAAEKWMEEHKGDTDVDKLTDEFLASVESSGSGDVVMADASGGDVEMVDAEPDDRKIGDPNPPEVKKMVHPEWLKELTTEMGFPELRAEKALYCTENASLEAAIEWLTQHAEDADIDLPLKKPAPPKPKMSKEEAQAKAAELQKKIREKKLQEEKLSEKEKERQRVESTKAMVEASERLKEEERKREIERQRREKEQAEKDRKELKEKMRLDYIERFGKEPPPEEEEHEKSIKEKSTKDQVAFYLGKLKKNYKDSNPEGLKTCLSTLKIYVKNLQDNPQDPKFKKLKLDNKAFQSRIAPFDGAIDFLDAMGFEKKEDCLEQRKSVPDGWLCGNAIKFIDLLLGQL